MGKKIDLDIDEDASNDMGAFITPSKRNSASETDDDVVTASGSRKSTSKVSKKTVVYEEP